MISRKNVIYVPVLRMKRGELDGLRLLRDDVSDCIAPLLIVPPANERHAESQSSLFPTGNGVPDVGGALMKYWQHRPVYVDPRVLFKECGVQESVNWLPELYSRAHSRGVHAIPVGSLDMLERLDAAAFKNSMPTDTSLKFGLRIQSGEMADPLLNERVRNALSNLGLVDSECTVFADFSDADLSEPSIVAPIIRGVLEQLQSFARWPAIVFLGTHYPDTNPATKPGQTVLHPRNEWRAWSEAVRFDPSTAEYMVFGDFAADSAKINFGGKGGRPIPHCRYTTESSWLVVRGDDTGPTRKVMKAVFQRIVDSGEFSGPTFSQADSYIFDVARSNVSSAGSPTTWRQVNTTHHITRVVADIAAVRKIPIRELPNEPSGSQEELLSL